MLCMGPAEAVPSTSSQLKEGKGGREGTLVFCLGSGCSLLPCGHPEVAAAAPACRAYAYAAMGHAPGVTKRTCYRWWGLRLPCKQGG